ncbi:MAG: amidohydrolase [Candidatus Geothermarchaeales archaeon]
MDILIRNCAILPMGGRRDLIKEGAVAIHDGRITFVGEASKARFRAEEKIEGRGMVALPGFVNCHTHVPMTLLRGIVEDMPLRRWLEDVVWPLEANLRPEDVYHGALLGCLEMVKHGVTTFSDMYFYEDSVAKAALEVGMRGFLAPGLIEVRDPEGARRGLKETIARAGKFNNKEGLIRYQFGPHATYTCSPEFLREVRRAASEHGIGIHLHLAESKEMVEEVRKRHGLHQVELLEEIGFLGPDVLAAHCIYLGEGGVEALARHGVKVSHNPVANMKLAQGMAPVAELLEAGVTVGLGTDGPASNNTLDLLGDARIAALLQKIRLMDPTVLPARKVLEMATRGGAAVLGGEDRFGSLEAGKRADVILLNFMGAHSAPVHDYYANVLYSCSGDDVETVIVDGRIVVRDGVVQTVDEASVVERASETAYDLVAR